MSIVACAVPAERPVLPGADDEVLADDDFRNPRRAGTVVGSVAADGTLRKGADVERVIGVDHDALRIAPLITPGWGRAALAYGPFRRANGLAFAVHMLNGHNTAQSENLPESFRSRINQWLAGAGVFPRWRRLLQWLHAGRKRRTWRQWRWWRATAIDAPPVPRIDDNLAVGWFERELPREPGDEGSAVVMRATGAENGELRLRAGTRLLAAARGVQNLPLYYVVVLREQGAAYYAASVPDAAGLGCYPALRPLGIDPHGDGPHLHASIHQSTLGQIGFRLDTRVYHARVARVAAWSAWYGSAHAADQQVGEPVGPRAALLEAERGGTWQPLGEDPARQVLDPRSATGLVHALIDCGSSPDPADVGLLWRVVDERNHWELWLSARGCELRFVDGGRSTTFARDERSLEAGRTHSVQILDDGCRIAIHLDGELLFGRRIDESKLADATSVGVRRPAIGSTTRVRRWEAHPRACALPAVLDLGGPWCRTGSADVVTEDFDGPSRDLAGKTSTSGSARWCRLVGSGHVDVDGSGQARVRADRHRPNPGRTLYTFDWNHPDFADLQVEITPPGSARGQAEGGRAGLVFWQDEDHYVIVNNWLADSYAGASISCFSCVAGFEDLYDAVWSNVGDQVRWGGAHRLRVAFDGERLMAWVDDQPVLYRALSDIYPDARSMQIRKVGMAANWEWGNDTGSVLRRFRARH